jgi:hypothetical protein
MPLDFGFYFLYSNRRSIRKACRVPIAALFFSKLENLTFRILVGIRTTVRLFPTGIFGGSYLLIAHFCTVQMGIELCWKKEYSNSD